ncbi:uncharacterized protein LOC62_02G002514 [Vanrija pseudolonga]|uniref:Uncharacterized protein n=1 Tax=Vanrija pseudolonga TaxID=143232 RepID=A0AAF0Y779_9TREE|nr:hypothetical protein LOC62_02G002514 [Vanrija pseudolonga]
MRFRVPIDIDADAEADDDDDAPHGGHYVRFSDAGETAAVIRLFLEFIVYARVEVPDDGTTLDSLRCMRAIVLFLKRYDCLPTLQLYLTCLREVVRQPSNISPLAAFVAGATAGDAFTCSTALDITDWVWRMMDRQNLPASPDANVFDPHHMPVAVWQLIPPMYTWALTTAWTGTEEHLHRHSSPGRRGMSDGSSSVGELVSRKVHSWQQWL